MIYVSSLFPAGLVTLRVEWRHIPQSGHSREVIGLWQPAIVIFSDSADYRSIRKSNSNIVLTLVTDRIRMGGNAITSIRLSVHCFHSIFGTDWRSILYFCLWVGHGHSSQGMEGYGYRSRSRSWVRLMQPVRSRSRAVLLVDSQFVRLSVSDVITYGSLLSLQYLPS